MTVKLLPDKGSIVSKAGWRDILGTSVYSRCWWLACILMAECILATVLPHPWLQGKSVMVSQGQPVTINPLPFRWLQARTVTESAIFFCVALLFFGRDRLKAVQWGAPPIHRGWLMLHGGSVALFVVSDILFKRLLYLNPAFMPRGSMLEHGAVLVWGVLLALVPVTLLQALLGLPKLLLLLRILGNAWGLAAVCSVLMMAMRSLLIFAWDRPHSWIGHELQVAAFRGVKFLLGLFYTGVTFDPAHFQIGTHSFSVIVADQCSGVEGLALMLSLTVGWLLYARRELRIGRALLLVPVSLALSWLLNLVRLAGLIAIGSAGYPKVALGGFHSQAGWILFNCVALGFLLTVNNAAWFRRDAFRRDAYRLTEYRRAGPEAGTDLPGVLQVGVSPLAHAPLASSTNLTDTNLPAANIAAVYLVPLLAILGVGLVVQAASDGFERLYALRLIAALIAIYVYRRRYRQMDWRFGWLGPAAGVFVFAFWIALNRWVGVGTGDSSGPILTSVAAGLAQMSADKRTAWIAVRAITAVTVIPLAEELAFRGYIARRLMSVDVESVSYYRLTVFAVLASSLAFGILHGRMWIAGILSGVVFAVVAKMRGRLGEAVAAHATANLLIAVWVITRGVYSLW